MIKKYGGTQVMANKKNWEEETSVQNENKESRVLFSFKDFFSIFTDFVKFCKETGPLRIVGYVVFFLFTAYAVHIGTHPEIIFEKYEEFAERRHAESFFYRMKTSPQIQSYMDQMRLESEGMRTFIIEMHNGKYNAAGLSFNYGALTYESVAEGNASVIDDYLDFALERYPTLGKIYEEGYWSGTVEELMEIDRHLALKLQSNNVEYIAATMIYGTKGDIGFIGVTYDHTDVNVSKTKQVLVKYAMKISPLLDGTQVGKEKK